MAQLSISADDFGKSKKANQNILELVKAGKIQRVSVLVDGLIKKSEPRELLGSKVKLDIHLVLPGTDYKKEQNKVIRRTFVFLGRLIAGKTTLNKVEKSWERQIKKFKKIFGKKPQGLNSHEHVHFFPPYFKIALRLSKKYKIPHIRSASKKVINSGNKIGRVLTILNGISKKSRTGYDYLTCLDWIGNFEKFSKNLPKGTIEIICHPERRDEYNKLIESN
jgi:predicted glycoside hydrolase/deacetylase ChbG (UPF0249 family)